MFDFDAICGGRRYFWKSLLAFDDWFWWYMWCSRALGYFIVYLRCLILMLFVVAGSTFESHCSRSMLDFVDICGVPEHLAMLHGYVIVCLRCLILMLFVVAGGIFRSSCFSSMLALLWMAIAACCDWSCSYNTSFACLRYLILTVVFFMFLSWFLGRIQQMCERNCVRFVNDFRLMLVWFRFVLDCFD